MPPASLPAKLLRARLGSLFDALPAATSGDVTSVHRARVASRRLREILPVLSDADGAPDLGRAGKDVRRITRVLGPVRELDVALGHLPDAARRAGVSARALAAVRRHLSRERHARRRVMLDVVTPAAIARLRARLGETRRPLAGAGHEAEILSARRRAARRAYGLRTAMRHAGGLYVSERLHAVRVAAKKLRYALEVDRELSRSRAMARINRLKALQDALGEIHDFEILVERIREVQTELAASDRLLADELDALVRSLETSCRDGHAAYLRDRPEFQRVCQAVIDAARQGRPTFK